MPSVQLCSVCEVFNYDRKTGRCCTDDSAYATGTAAIDSIVYYPVTAVTAKRAPTVSLVFCLKSKV